MTLSLISIITPAFNAAAYLTDCIESVLNQDYPQLEHIVIDDGSTDNGATVKILESFPHLKWWTRANKGQYPTLNEGLRNAKGEIICFISADDLLQPYSISRAANYLQRTPSVDGVYGKIQFMFQDGTEYPVSQIINTGPGWLYPYLRFLSHASLFIRKKYLMEHELFFSENLKFTGDYDWFIQMTSTGIRLAYIPELFARVRLHQNQSSQQHRAEIQAEHQVVLSAHKISRVLYFIADKLIIYRGAVIRLYWMFREKGLKAALKLFIQFLKKRVLF